MTNLIKVIFVDGPTGVGKDYFIDNLAIELDKEKPNLTYEVLRATDFVLKDAKSEDRKYTHYQTEIEKIYSIFTGHINMLCYIYETLNSSKKEVDLIIVNRSFLSFLIYNIYPIIRNYNISSDNEIHYIKETMLNSYIDLFNNLFQNTESMFVNLTTEDYTLISKQNKIIDRIKSRNDGKPLDEKWLELLIKEYHYPNEKLMGIFTRMEEITSDGYRYIVRKYL